MLLRNRNNSSHQRAAAPLPATGKSPIPGCRGHAIAAPAALFLTTILILLCGSAVKARAQTFGSISGVVKDTSGALIIKARVTATNTATGVSRTVSSNADGIYSFPTLQPGRYQIRVESTGFETEIQNNITVNALAPVTLNLSLHAGSVSQVVQVTAARPQLIKKPRPSAPRWIHGKWEIYPSMGEIMPDSACWCRERSPAAITSQI